MTENEPRIIPLNGEVSPLKVEEAMVQSADLCQFDRRTPFGRLNGALLWSIFGRAKQTSWQSENTCFRAQRTRACG